ncbi:MAG: Omp28-related outer membrane protein [Chitinophagales bacterium]|nr:Omp28-related outer membrane protein [Bacteroidota bacterium]
MISVKYRLGIFFLIALSMVACEEEPPTINFGVADEEVSYDNEIQAAQEKNVLIEEFSGVQCVNCPAGAAKIEEIVATLGERVIPVTLHAGQFAVPIPNVSQYDFNIPEAEELNTFFGVQGYPSSVIDRYQFSGQFSIVNYNPNTWQSFVGERLAESTPINIDIHNTVSNNTLQCQVEINYTQAVSDNNKLSVYIIEDNIIDAQDLVGNVIDTTYVHKHVVRAMLTVANGVTLIGNNVEKPAGTKILRNFTYENIPAEWDLAHCEVVALVQAGEVSSIYQVAREHFLP